MAKIDISFEDLDGGVDIKFNFDPPLSEIKPGDETQAQGIVAEIIHLLTSIGAAPE